jgi:hypothetical protein
MIVGVDHTVRTNGRFQHLFFSLIVVVACEIFTYRECRFHITHFFLLFVQGSNGKSMSTSKSCRRRRRASGCVQGRICASGRSFSHFPGTILIGRPLIQGYFHLRVRRRRRQPSILPEAYARIRRRRNSTFLFHDVAKRRSTISSRSTSSST